jgi:hypothetical protein
MKKSNYILIAAACLLLYGCSKTPSVAPNVPFPSSGTFSGQFSLYHINAANGEVIRTDTCTLNLILSSGSAYKITGDTATLHAGSYGIYQVNQAESDIEFNDRTFPTSGTPAKVHLSGYYEYQYVGSSLKILSYGPADTLEYFYNLTQTN